MHLPTRRQYLVLLLRCPIWERKHRQEENGELCCETCRAVGRSKMGNLQRRPVSAANISSKVSKQWIFRFCILSLHIFMLSFWHGIHVYNNEAGAENGSHGPRTGSALFTYLVFPLLRGNLNICGIFRQKIDRSAWCCNCVFPPYFLWTRQQWITVLFREITSCMGD